MNQHHLVGLVALGLGPWFAPELASASPSPRQEPLTPSKIDREEVRARVEAIAKAVVDAGVPGVSIAIGKDSELWFAEGFGYADAAQGDRVAGDTVFHVGTLARQFTAVGILQLVEAKELALDDELGELLPDFPAWGKKITLEQLLAGTSGIPSWAQITGEPGAKPAAPKSQPFSPPKDDERERKKDSDKDERPQGGGSFEPLGVGQEKERPKSPQTSGGQGQEKGGRAASPDPAGGERQFFARFLGVEPEFPAGTAYSGDSAGWLLLDRILARASGQTYAAYVKTHLVEPLELERTMFCPTGKRWIREADDCKQVEVEVGTDRTDGGASDDASPWLCSSATDLFRWTSALAGRELLGEEATRKMWSAQTLADGSSTGAGFAVTISTLESFRVVGNTGGVGGYAVRVGHYPDAGATVVVLANCATAPVERMEQDIARALLGLLPEGVADLALAAEDVPKYAGTYMIATTRIRVFEKDGKLWWEEPAQPAFALLFQGRGAGRGVFVSAADHRTRFTFKCKDEEENDGPADRVEVTRNGLVSTGQRVAQDARERTAGAGTRARAAE